VPSLASASLLEVLLVVSIASSDVAPQVVDAAAEVVQRAGVITQVLGTGERGAHAILDTSNDCSLLCAQLQPPAVVLGATAGEQLFDVSMLACGIGACVSESA
jgi:hypothetical protein